VPVMGPMLIVQQLIVRPLGESIAVLK